MADGDQIGPAGMTPQQAADMSAGPEGQPTPQPAPSPTPGAPVSAVHDQGGPHIGPAGITPAQAADMPAGPRGPANYESADHARTTLGGNIVRAVARGLTSPEIYAATYLERHTPGFKPLDYDEAHQKVYEAWGIAAPKPEDDPIQFKAGDPHPETTEFEWYLEHGWGEFGGGLVSPLPELGQLGAAAKAVGGVAAKTGIPQVAGKAAVAAGQQLARIPGVATTATKAAAVASQIRRIGSVAPGADPQSTLGMRTGIQTVQQIEAGLARLPGGEAIMNRVNDLNLKYGDGVEEIIQNLASGRDVSATTIGKELEKKIGDERLAEMRKQGKDVYDEVHDLVQQWHGSVAVYPRDMLATLEDLITPTEAAGHVDPLTGRPVPAPGEALERMIVIKQKFENWHGALKQSLKDHGYVPYESMKKIRTEIGREIDSGPFSDLPNAQMRRLYEGMTDDMMHGAATIGDHVVAAINRANTAWKAIKDEQRILEDVLNKQGGPEKVFASLMRSGLQGVWGGGATTIRTVLNAVDKPTRDLIAAGALRRMGRATSGIQEAFEHDAFNAGTFFKNWKSMSDEAREALFGNLPQNYADNMSRLQRHMEALRHFEKVLPNPSGTSKAWYWGRTIEGMVLALVTGSYHVAAGIAGTYLGNKIVASALTKPQTVRWLADKTAQMLIYATKGVSGVTSGKPTGKKTIDEIEREQQQQPPNFSELTE